MKKLLAFNIFLMITLLLSATGRAADEKPWIEKKKVITRAISLSGKQKLSIINSFGTVNIRNGNKKEAWVEITIRASSVDENIAQTIFDQIRIDEKTEGSIVSFETKVGGNNGKSRVSRGNKTNSKMEINYEVVLPQNFPLYVKNGFGNTFISDRSGSTELNQSFGDLTIGNLYRDADIKIEFGKLIADGIDGSKIKSSYSEVNVKNLAGNLKTSFEFCKKLQLGLSHNLESLTVNTSYSDLKIIVPRNFDGDFTIKTSFGKALGGGYLTLTDETKEQKYGPVFDRTYTGKSGNGKTAVVVNSSFGNVRFD